MKRFINNLLLVSTFALLFGSCKKDEVKAVLTVPGSIPSFTSSASSVVLSSTNDSTTVVKFNWLSPYYGFSAVVSYTLYFDLPADTSGANAWANAIKVTTATNANQQAYLGNTPIYLGGDLIVAIDNDRVTSPQDVSEIMDRHQAGDTVTVTFFRGSRKMTAKLTLAEAHSVSV